MESFFWKYYFEHATFLYLSRRSRGHHQSFFNFRSSSRMSQSQQKTSKKDHTFYNKISLKKPHLFHLTLKTICNRNTAKKRSDFTYFQQRCFCLGSEKIFALHHFVMPVCIFLYISLRKFLFREHSKVLSGRECMGGAWISSLRRLTVSLAKCFTIFHLIEILENSIIF